MKTMPKSLGIMEKQAPLCTLHVLGMLPTIVPIIENIDPCEFPSYSS